MNETFNRVWISLISLGAAGLWLFALPAQADPVCPPIPPDVDLADAEWKNGCPILKGQEKKSTASPKTPRKQLRALKDDRFDKECPIPESYRDSIDKAWQDATKKIIGNAKCRGAYAAVLKNDSAAQVIPKLSSQRFALADACKSLGDRLERAHNSRSLGEAAYSKTGGDTIHFAESTLKAGPQSIACSIMHETAHLAGAPADPFIEIGIEKIHADCGCARY